MTPTARRRVVTRAPMAVAFAQMSPRTCRVEFQCPHCEKWLFFNAQTEDPIRKRRWPQLGQSPEQTQPIIGKKRELRQPNGVFFTQQSQRTCRADLFCPRCDGPTHINLQTEDPLRKQGEPKRLGLSPERTLSVRTWLQRRRKSSG